MNKRQILKKINTLSNIFISILSIFPMFIKKILFSFGNYLPGIVGVYWRYITFKSISKDSGVNIYIAKNVYLKNIENIIIGSNVSIHEMCYLDGYGGITISDNVSIAHSSSLISFDHTYQDINTPIKYNPSIKKEITIDTDVWIGAGVRILGDVTIGTRVIIAAGSVVTKNTEAHSIYGGIPAKKIKNMEMQ